MAPAQAASDQDGCAGMHSIASNTSSILVTEAEPPLDCFVLYGLRGQPLLCAEPVSRCMDWLNLRACHGPGPPGGARLGPGETLAARFSLRPDRD